MSGKENQETKMRSEVARGKSWQGVPKAAETVEGGVTRNTVSVTHSINVKEDSIKKFGARSCSGQTNGKEWRRG